MNNINKQNREQNDSYQRGGGLGSLVKKVKRLSQKKKKNPPYRPRQQYGDYQREKETGDMEEGLGWINGDGKRCDLG